MRSRRWYVPDVLDTRHANGLPRALAPLAALVVLSVGLRAPALVNAGTVNSDAAVVGLQARHLLHDGGLSAFLWGSGYQTSVDSCVAAAAFVLLGTTPLALVLSTLAGHTVATCLAFLTLARHVPRSAAFVATLPLVFTASPLLTYVLNPPRQASLTLVFVAVYLIDGAPMLSGRARKLRLALGAAASSLACFADPYALLFLPPLVVFAVVVAVDAAALVGWRAGLRAMYADVLVTLTGGALGAVPFALLLTSPRAVHGETRLILDAVGHNLALLRYPCLPWLLGASAFVPKALLGYVPWAAPRPLAFVMRAGAVVFLALVTAGGVSSVCGREARAARRLGGLGFVVASLTLGSFLLSVMVMDLFSSRYLAAIVLISPFALAPAAARLGGRALLLVLAPFLVGAGVTGWVGFGDEVDGLRVVALPGGGSRDELTLEATLLSRGVTTAIADYWVAYRLTFLYDEAVAVVPIHANEDRHAPYREALRAASRAAYIFDPQRSREQIDAMEREAFGGSHPGGVPVDRVHAGALRAVVFDKAPGYSP